VSLFRNCIIELEAGIKREVRGPSGLERGTAAKIEKVMERLGIDIAYGAVPRFGLAFSSALRSCNSCTAGGMHGVVVENSRYRIPTTQVLRER
jgi:hypothetical protein